MPNVHEFIWWRGKHMNVVLLDSNLLPSLFYTAASAPIKSLKSVSLWQFSCFSLCYAPHGGWPTVPDCCAVRDGLKSNIVVAGTANTYTPSVSCWVYLFSFCQTWKHEWMFAYLQLMIKLWAPLVKCETHELNISISGANNSVLCVKSTQDSLFLYTLMI